MDGFRYMLAPMEDFSGGALRTLCHMHGADLTFTEMVRVGALARRNNCTWSRLEIRDDTPTVIQLIGSKDHHFRRFLEMYQPQKGFQGFNLNIACPSPEMIRLGQGCAMVRKISKTGRIVSIFREYGYPVSVKMRLGLNRMEKENKIYLKIIEAVDADFFVVHARHGAQTYRDPADFGVYVSCVRTGKPIIANGDIKTRKQAEGLRGIGLAGVMIGRAAVEDPSIFSKLRGLPAPPVDELKRQYISLCDTLDEPVRCSGRVLNHLGKPGLTVFDREI